MLGKLSALLKPVVSLGGLGGLGGLAPLKPAAKAPLLSGGEGGGLTPLKQGPPVKVDGAEDNDDVSTPAKPSMPAVEVSPQTMMPDTTDPKAPYTGPDPTGVHRFWVLNESDGWSYANGTTWLYNHVTAVYFDAGAQKFCKYSAETGILPGVCVADKDSGGMHFVPNSVAGQNSPLSPIVEMSPGGGDLEFSVDASSTTSASGDLSITSMRSPRGLTSPLALASGVGSLLDQHLAAVAETVQS